jgi:hypothetical protein
LFNVEGSKRLAELEKKNRRSTKIAEKHEEIDKTFSSPLAGRARNQESGIPDILNNVPYEVIDQIEPDTMMYGVIPGNQLQ